MRLFRFASISGSPYAFSFAHRHSLCVTRIFHFSISHSLNSPENKLFPLGTSITHLTHNLRIVRMIMSTRLCLPISSSVFVLGTDRVRESRVEAFLLCYCFRHCEFAWSMYPIVIAKRHKRPSVFFFSGERVCVSLFNVAFNHLT